MHENGITAAFAALGDKINQLETELSIQRHLYADMKQQKEEGEKALAKMRAAHPIEFEPLKGVVGHDD